MCGTVRGEEEGFVLWIVTPDFLRPEPALAAVKVELILPSSFIWFRDNRPHTHPTRFFL
jgi:hypothetical protein